MQFNSNSINSNTPKQTPASARWVLFLAAALILGVWQLPLGHTLLYPLTLFATFTHEMGHGLTALVMGQNFERMVINMDGSGVATWTGHPGNLTIGLIAAGGLVGPSIAGSTLLILSRSPQYARLLLTLLMAVLVATVVIWVRNPFGIAFLLTWAAVFGLSAKFCSNKVAFFILSIVALTQCLSLFTDIDYMFSQQANVSGQVHLSDSEAMARALWLPYWFWGGVVAVFSLFVSTIGILIATSRPKTSSLQ